METRVSVCYHGFGFAVVNSERWAFAILGLAAVRDCSQGISRHSGSIGFQHLSHAPRA